MSILSLQDIEKSFGAEPVLKGADIQIEPGERAGLVGVNGCGKTTLLEIISGKMRPDSGTVSISKGTDIGYLEQNAGAGSQATLLEAMLTARPEVLRLKDRIVSATEEVERLAEQSGEGYEAALDEYGKLLEEFDSSGGYAYENEVTGALTGLGFTQEDFARQIATLSGGERTRLALARLLVAGHDLLLLDEPTNHLDITAIAWLEGFLSRFEGAALIVSHDRYFLDRVATRILELDGGRVESFPGNYSRYRIEKQKRYEARKKEYELAVARYEKEKEYINRMRAGVNSRQAKGREKRLDRFELPDAPSVKGRPIRLELETAGRSSDAVVSAEKVAKSYGSSTVLSGVSLTVRRGERVGIVGPNGSGKSTLLKILMGELSPDSGTVTIGGKVRAGYYAQGLEGLNDSDTVIGELWGVSPLSTEQEIRDLLGAFLFSGDDASKKVDRLSGGEKGRLAISKIVLKGANLLVLDEPTNHLDIPSREALEDAISGFGGTVIAVSHDRFFLDRFATRILELDCGSLTQYWGNYTDYLRRKSEPEMPAEQLVSEGRRSWEEMKELRSMERMKEKEEQRRRDRIGDIEEEIEAAELKLHSLESELADPDVFGDYARVAELTRRYDELREQRDRLYEQLDKETAI